MLVEILDRSTVESGVDHLEACDDLEPWFTEGATQSTFHKLRSLTHRATSMAMLTMSNLSIFWTDRAHYSEMIFQGHQIRFEDLRKAVHDIQEGAVGVWENGVLLGLPIRVDYEHIVDNMADCRVGYSCFQDPRNECFKDKDRLWRAVLTNDQLRERFLRVGVDGGVVWNRTALFRWLQDYGRFSGLLMTLAETTAGSAIRATELHAMIANNTKSRSSRNFLVMGDYCALMVRYTKTGSMQKHDRTIPHALDAVTADLMVQDHAIARPFAR